MRVHISFHVNIFVFLDKCPEVELLNHIVISIFDFLRIFHTSFQSGYTSLHHHQQYTRSFFSSHPCQHLLFVAFLIIASLTGMRWSLIVVLISTSLKITDYYWCIFSCTCWPSMCLWKMSIWNFKMSVQILTFHYLLLTVKKCDLF